MFRLLRFARNDVRKPFAMTCKVRLRKYLYLHKRTDAVMRLHNDVQVKRRSQLNWMGL
ncbi:hypothetical protein SAMN05720758_1166 [Fibrobacter sp. UWB11]|nr:hypothetical protein SAMN05720758_1166 [Fibrobacter sp. UWB11]